MFAIGAIALVSGGLSPLSAFTLAACGGGLAFASLRFLSRWQRAEPMSSPHAALSRSSGRLRRPAYFIE